MTTQWTGRSRPSSSSQTKRPSVSSSSFNNRTPTQSDYEVLQNNASVTIQDNEGNDILVHSGNFYDKTTEWSGREAI